MSVKEPAVVPGNTTYVYFDNLDNLPLCTWMVTEDDEKASEFLRELERLRNQREMDGRLLEFVVKEANKIDKQQRTSTYEHGRCPRILIVGNTFEGGSRGSQLELNQDGWQHFMFANNDFFMSSQPQTHSL